MAEPHWSSVFTQRKYYEPKQHFKELEIFFIDKWHEEHTFRPLADSIATGFSYDPNWRILLGPRGHMTHLVVHDDILVDLITLPL